MLYILFIFIFDSWENNKTKEKKQGIINKDKTKILGKVWRNIKSAQ